MSIKEGPRRGNVVVSAPERPAGSNKREKSANKIPGYEDVLHQDESINKFLGRTPENVIYKARIPPNLPTYSNYG